ncbi:MAG TPA: hypothetical protein PLI09_27540 [Candidatus Hydrogenedentes bacterium]|nr:hypothetical protein [Candidatus Hydrogenedentota bacterium]
MKLRVALHGIVLVCFSITATAQTPYLVKDINTTLSQRSSPDSYAYFNDRLFYPNADEAFGLELWACDLSGNAERVKDIEPGTGSGRPIHIAVVNNQLFFAGFQLATGYELWKSDGSEGGTSLVKDINPGAGSGFVIGVRPLFTEANGEIFFQANDGIHGNELWKSDGTEAGTVLVKDIQTGSEGSSIHNLIAFGDTVLFGAFTTTNGDELWISDGTEAGTHLVRDIVPDGLNPFPVETEEGEGTGEGEGAIEEGECEGECAGEGEGEGEEEEGWDDFCYYPPEEYSPSSYPSRLIYMNGYAYFLSTGGLGRTDGTEMGTVEVAYLTRLEDMQANYPFTEMDGMFYFNGRSMEGCGLWKSDGTPSGTQRIKQYPYCLSYYYSQYLVNAGGRLFFAAYTGTSGSELWTSDGTPEGTVMVKDIYPGYYGSIVYDNNEPIIAVVNGVAVFPATDGTNGTELWRSDGTEAGTYMLVDLAPGPCSGLSGTSPKFIMATDNLFFYSSAAGQIWVTDGTTSGTRSVTGLFSGTLSSNPSNFVKLDDITCFSAIQGEHAGIWRTDGTGTGTYLIKEIEGGDISSLVAVAGYLFFVVYDFYQPCQLWRSDGTESGIVLLKEFNYEGMSPQLYAAGRLAYFYSDDSDTFELWCAGLTSDCAMRILKQDGVNPFCYRDREFCAVDDTLFFEAKDEHGVELWATNGTRSTTRLIKDINPGSASTVFGGMAAYQQELFFGVHNSEYISELWRSDGTETGTVQVKAINMEPDSWCIMETTPSSDVPVLGPPYGFYATNKLLWFSAYSGDSGWELWRSDGTETGTYCRADWTQYGQLGPDEVCYPVSSYPGIVGPVGEKLCITAEDDCYGSEPWIDNGSTGYINLLADINPTGYSYVDLCGDEWCIYCTFFVPDGSSPAYVGVTNTELYFSAYNDAAGRELWRTNGTAAGTVLVYDINPGPSSSYLGKGITVNGTLFFTANNGVCGAELWAVTVEGSGEGEGEMEGGGEGEVESALHFHTADQDRNYEISVSELLRVIQLYNSDGYHIEFGTEDDLAPGLEECDCAGHTSDYNPSDCIISLAELLRLIQLYNSHGYHFCSEGEDGFCPGL